MNYDYESMTKEQAISLVKKLSALLEEAKAIEANHKTVVRAFGG